MNRATIPVFIPFVNRLDLLRLAVLSVPRRLTTEPIVINNSGAELSDAVWGQCGVITPSIPLTFSQTQNLMLEMSQSHPFYFFMHSDAEDDEGILDRLREMAMQQREKWGAIFTAYDALACYNTAAMNAIGGWDVNIPWYRSECDLYRRLRLAGYPTLESHLRVKHEPSQTLNADPAIKARVDEENKTARLYYIQKWGGDNGKEKYEVSFNGEAQA